MLLYYVDVEFSDYKTIYIVQLVFVKFCHYLWPGTLPFKDFKSTQTLLVSRQVWISQLRKHVAVSSWLSCS